MLTPALHTRRLWEGCMQAPGCGEGRRKLEEKGRGLHCLGASGEDTTSPEAKTEKKPPVWQQGRCGSKVGEGGREPGQQRGSPPASCQAQSCSPTPTPGDRGLQNKGHPLPGRQLG